MWNLAKPIKSFKKRHEEKDNHMEIAGDFSLVKGHYDLRVYADFTYGKTLMITYSGYLEE